MTAANHALTGAVLTIAISNPAVALPLAFASHFVLDAIPHYDDKKRMPHHSRWFLLRLLADAALAASLLVFIVTFLPEVWPAVVAGALLAMSPDLMWLPNYARTLRGKEHALPGRMMQLHKRIQQYERPWGLFVEIAWFVVFFWLLLKLIARTL